MKRYLERVYSNASPVDKAWAIIDHLGDEARSFIINKPESERDSHEKVTTLLSSIFGTGSSRWPVRQAFRLRNQLEKEGLMQYLDALEGLRSQGFPDEPITTRRYEILHRFMDGVSDPVLQRELTVVFATEAYLADPPTVESLRFTVQNSKGVVTNNSLVTQGAPRLYLTSAYRATKCRGHKWLRSMNRCHPLHDGRRDCRCRLRQYTQLLNKDRPQP